MPSPFTIIQGKEGQQPKKPLVLVTVTAYDGDVAYFATPNDLGGDIVYNGNTYQARVMNNDIQAFQAMGPQGYDSVPGFNLTLSDGDHFVWNNHCWQHGWRGSTITLTIVLWDAVARQFSTDALQMTFIGGNPQHDHAAGKTTVDAIALTNYSRIKVPSILVQGTCTWTFPQTYLQRIAAQNDFTSINYQCGYCADLSGGIGNLIANTTTTSSIASTGSPITVSVSSTANFPATPFQFTIDGEEFLATNVAAGVVTANRAQHGTSMGPHSSGAGFKVPFTTCDLTRSSLSNPSIGCMARLGNASDTSISIDGNLLKDKAGNNTGRFGGCTWLAPAGGWKGKQYISGQQQFGFNQQNTAIPGTAHNWVYGTQWVPVAPLAPAGDPNSNRTEGIVCIATDGNANVIQVVCNGVIIPYNNSDVLFTWRYITQGGRNGNINRDAIFNTPNTQSADPHGSACVIEVVVPSQLSASGSVPQIQALVTGPPTLQCYPIASASSSASDITITLVSGVSNANIGPGATVVVKGNSFIQDGAYTVSASTFGPPGTITLGGTTSTGSGTGGGVFFSHAPDLYDTGVSPANNQAGPACNLVWAVMDLMSWGNTDLSQFDALSWYNAAQVAATTLTYTASNGSSQTHAQFKASFALQGANRQQLSQVITALRNGGNLMIGPNSSTGLIECYVRQTLADQQPAAIAGSNTSTPISSIHADLTTANGYPAYAFDETNIEEGSFKVTTQRIESTPNTVSTQFQDEYNGYVQDSITTVDPKAYAYSGNQEIQVPIPMMGPPNFDQLTRVGNVQLAETLYGNPRNDPGGTLYFEFTTNHRVLHLLGRLGYICTLTWQDLNIGTGTPQLVRILSLQPDTDGEHWRVKAAWHQDVWYSYAYGQNPAPFQTNPLLSPPNRPPFPWQPDLAVFDANDALWPNGTSFNLYTGGTGYPNQVAVTGLSPVNAQPAIMAPAVPLQGSTANTGGSIKPGTYYISISSNTQSGPVSNVITTVVPAGTNTNTITISNLQWPKGTFSIGAFAGTSPMEMVYQGAPGGANYTGSSPDANGNDTSFTFTSIGQYGVGLPDVVFSRYRMQETVLMHGGVWGATIPAGGVSGAVVTIAHLTPWTTNLWQNYVLSLYYRPGANPQPGLNRTVVSSGSNTLTLNAAGFQAGDVVVMRSRPTIVTSNTIGDPNWLNDLEDNDLGLAVNAEVGNLVWIIAGTGAGQSPKKIVSNTDHVITINGTWDITPDATSIHIITAPGPFEDAMSSPIQQSTFSATAPTAVVSANMPAGAVDWTQSVLVQVATADQNGKYFPMQYQPFREIYFPNLGQGDKLLALSVPGTLAIGSDQAPRVQMTSDLSATTIQALVKNAPTGASLVVDISYQDGTGAWNIWATCTLTPGTTLANAPTPATSIPAGSPIRLDITGVGTTFPGSDLTVQLFA